MGLRTPGTGPNQAVIKTSAASGQSDQGDFESAFADLLKEDAPKPKADKEMKPHEEEGAEDLEDDEEIETTDLDEPKPVEQDPIESIEANAKAAREKWKLQKENKELKAELEKAKAEKSSGINVDSDNPLRDLGKLKGWSKDDIVNKALEAMEDDGLTPEEAKKEVKTMTQEEIIAKVKAELKAEAEEENKKNITTKTINEFKEKIKTYAKDNADKFPLIDGLGGSESVYQTIEQDYLQKEEEFGVEYAQKNMMTVEQAAKKVNDTLAQSVRNTLKSEHVRKFILAALKEEGTKETKGDQLEDFFQLEDEPSTLTNKSHRKITDPKDSRELTEEERFEQAFAYLKD
jgi:transcriptional regulator NrdR family protein